MDRSKISQLPGEITEAQHTPLQSYLYHIHTLHDIISNDHFGGGMPTQIIQQWVKVLEPGSRVPLPENLKGFYGGSLRASVPIEIARGSYKYIAHETKDKDKIAKYARRMLITLSVLDLDTLAEQEPDLCALVLWHKALAQVRLVDGAKGLAVTLLQYEKIRPRSKLPDSKLPQPERLQSRLAIVAKDIGNDQALKWLTGWQTS